MNRSIVGSSQLLLSAFDKAVLFASSPIEKGRYHSGLIGLLNYSIRSKKHYRRRLVMRPAIPTPIIINEDGSGTDEAKI